MKISPVLAVLALATSAVPSQADDAPSPAISPELQALVIQLLKGVETAPSEPAPVPAAKTAGPSAPAAASLQSKTLAIGSLSTGSLTSKGLAPSASLGGRGTAGGTPRLTAEDWRSLFPAKPLRP